MTSHACKWLIDPTSWFTFIVWTVWLEVINNSKCQEFSMPLYSNIDHRNDVKMFNTHVKPQAAGEWFHWKVLNILTSFLWSRRVQTMDSYCRLVFYHNIDSFDFYFCWNCATITSFLCPVLLTNVALDQSACEKSLSHGKRLHAIQVRLFSVATCWTIKFTWKVVS